jgi:ParB-like chromosome segregation protein Spo0J
MEIKQVKTSTIQPYPNNPRIISKKAVKAVEMSIKEYGFQNPILLSGKEVIAGHTRLQAALQLGLPTVPTIQVKNLTAEQVQAFRIADNKTGEFSKWDETKLQAELSEITGFTGFDEDTLSELQDNIKQAVNETVEDIDLTALDIQDKNYYLIELTDKQLQLFLSWHKGKIW